jgi:hypothetical protein
MPLLTRVCIRAGLIYLAVALMLGLALSLPGLPSSASALRPVYVHLLIVGWITNLIIGVGYWMFPKYSKEQPRGNERLGWAVVILLNTGLIVRALAEPLVASRPDANAGWLLVLSAALQVLAAWGFVYNTWPRIRER